RTVLKDYLLKDNQKNKVSIVKKQVKGSQTAILEVKGLGNKNNLSLLKIKVETGRSYQIRVQLAGFGFPLYGDQNNGTQINNYPLVNIQLESGRSDPILVQLAGFRIALYRAQKYGATINKVDQQIALWSHKLRLKHPTKDQMIEIVSNPPNISPWDQFKII